MKYLLDGNIYDLVGLHKELIVRINERVKSGQIEIVCDQIVERELKEAPLGGLPDWFPIRRIMEPGAFIGSTLIAPNDVAESDERYAKIVPNVSTYSKHLGESSKKADAIIADTASKKVDCLVTEDKRMKARIEKIQDIQLRVIRFGEFVSEITC